MNAFFQQSDIAIYSPLPQMELMYDIQGKSIEKVSYLIYIWFKIFNQFFLSKLDFPAHSSPFQQSHLPIFNPLPQV